MTGQSWGIAQMWLVCPWVGTKNVITNMAIMSSQSWGIAQMWLVCPWLEQKMS